MIAYHNDEKIKKLFLRTVRTKREEKINERRSHQRLG